MVNNNSESETVDYVITPTDYKTAIKDGVDISVRFKAFKPSLEGQIIKIIHRYLAKYDILYIKDTVVAITKEVINNAIKANLKRLYFDKKGLDINNIADYREGMTNFKSETFQSDFIDELDRSTFKTMVTFKLDSENLILSVANNVKILDSELKKVQTRIEKAYQYADISEVFDDILDDSEGAGLGLIMSVMMMKNSGFKPGSYTISQNGDNTVSKISIPQKFTEEKVKEKISDEIINEIKELPSFPENILQIKNLCNDPESTVKKIAEHISMDPGLAASVLKLANSAGYLSVQKVDTIEGAVVKIGFRGIKTLITASGVCSIMDGKYKNKFKQYDTIWKNSYKRAYYAQKLTSRYNLTKINEIVYLAALLIDIGKIVLLSVNPELAVRIKNITNNDDMENFNIVEEMSLGVSFSYIGSLISKKWNFGDTITYAIAFGKKPYMADPQYKAIINTIYLADCLVDLDNKRTRFNLIDEDVLSFFKLEDQEAFEKLYTLLNSSYNSDDK